MISALKWIRWNIIKVFSEMFGFLIENSEYLKLVVKKEGEPQFLPSLDHPPNPTTPRHVRATASGRISPD